MIRVGIYGNNLHQGYFLAALLGRLGAQAKVFLPVRAHAQDTHSWWSDEPLDESLVVRLDAVPDPGAPGRLKSQLVVRRMYSAAAECDILILREEGPALFSELSSVPKIFSSQGADLQLWPWWLKTYYSPQALGRQVKASWNHPGRVPLLRRVARAGRVLAGRARSLPRWLRCQMRQRLGIRQCMRAIVFPYQRYLLDALGYPPERVRYIPIPGTPPEVLGASPDDLPAQLRQVAEEADLLLVHPARMFFLRTDGNRFLKDNDKLLIAFGEFVREYDGDARLVLFEKGREEDLHAARQLVSRSGASERVIWLPELSNRALRAVLAHPKTVVCDQFSPFLNSLGNLGRESVYFGRPLITSYDGEDDRMYTSAPPNVFFANSVQTILSAMRRVARLTAAERFRLAVECAEWYRCNLDPLLNAGRYLDLCREILMEGGRQA